VCPRFVGYLLEWADDSHAYNFLEGEVNILNYSLEPYNSGLPIVS
jgi:hypothetical protein